MSNNKIVFTNRIKVRMHDTDLAGVIYFAKQFRFAHDTWEEFLEEQGFSIHSLLREKDYSFAVVHAKADYFAPLIAGDSLRVDLSVTGIGNSSFTTAFDIYKEDKKVGYVEIVFACIHQKTRLKHAVPMDIKGFLSS